MDTGWRYRLASVGGVAALVGLAVMLANNGTVQAAASAVPVLGRLPVDPPAGAEFVIEVALTAAVVAGAFVPLYKPRPRRILDIVALAHKRTFVAVFALATIGYFDYTYKVPRLTLVLITPLLLLVLPAWFVWLRRPEARSERAIVVGDDPTQIATIARGADLPLLGYLCPTVVHSLRGSEFGRDDREIETPGAAHAVDGGRQSIELSRLGGLSRLEDILVEQDVDTVVLAFDEPDRAEFFGALDACYEHGVAAKVHPAHADTVLTDAPDPNAALVDVEIEPWDIQDYLFKRGFDIAFSLTGLLTLAPVIAVIAAAIKFEDRGPVLYRQERTAVFGETFPIFKFRSMTPEGESATPIDDEENDRITRVGRILRKTHLDEIPQLWSILRGDMSVVGPRAVWTEEEHLLEDEAETWRKRWFVKPGLTGLAQINEASSVDPRAKLRYDLQYVREQSFAYDLKIVARQLWKVAADVVSTLW
ncbi:sugar transferase [Halorubrum ezzemoulense]|uniref:Exopolysaccharide biosynthesis polyprenyl glycosylphosphotransferase n=1 Tax=Halorubrum ezzemoulense TaxID=337243 RepID=A0A256J786_HALEZ|nr:sugar transferase [Halorubrum ezzemoulense]OYR64573.1 exopolysaccharide biosynthesis polyprenyl glycosylphosphotransferase [Halorubrum ezzemoulense]